MLPQRAQITRPLYFHELSIAGSQRGDDCCRGE